LKLINDSVIDKGDLLRDLQGWFGYAKWADTYNFRTGVIDQIKE